MLLDFTGIQLFINHLCRYTDRRLGDQNLTFRHRRKRRQFFPDSFCEYCSAHNAVRNIRPKLHASFHQLFLRKSQPEHLVHSVKHCRSIGTSACHSRCNRYMLVQMDSNPIFDIKFIDQKLCRFPCNIVLIIRQIKKIRIDLDTWGRLLLQRHIIVQI